MGLNVLLKFIIILTLIWSEFMNGLILRDYLTKSTVNLELSVTGRDERSHYSLPKTLNYSLTFTDLNKTPWQLGVSLPNDGSENDHYESTDETCVIYNGLIESLIITDCFRSMDQIKGFVKIMHCLSRKDHSRSGFFRVFDTKFQVHELEVSLTNSRTKELAWYTNSNGHLHADNPMIIGEYKMEVNILSGKIKTFRDLCKQLRNDQVELRVRRDSNSPIQVMSKDPIFDNIIDVFRPAEFPINFSEYPIYKKEIENAKDMKFLSQSPDELPNMAYREMYDNLIELLIVTTTQIKEQYGDNLEDYIKSTINSVSHLLRLSSLRARIRISITDIVILDNELLEQLSLRDWSKYSQEDILNRFCAWVGKIRRQTYNWDSAVLINKGPFNSSALGVAHRASMCNSMSNCIVSLDKGFGTAHILAHELGHQLSSNHDFEPGSDCGKSIPDDEFDKDFHDLHQRRLNEFFSKSQGHLTTQNNTNFDQFNAILKDTVMSGEIFYELYPPRWSKCSRNSILDFLKSESSACLRTDNSMRVLFNPDQLRDFSNKNNPGNIFTLDQQCSISASISNVKFCTQDEVECKHLQCSLEGDGKCLPPAAVWADGTPCNNGRGACFYGDCVDGGVRPTPIHGGWGEWGPWSECSRTCNGGVQFSERACNNPVPKNSGDYCVGNYIRTRSCGITPCQYGNFQSDPRQDLCDELGREMSLRLVAYKPKFNEKTACKLICLSGQKTIPHNLTLKDGTECYDQYKSICIQGECYRAGCDGILGSDKKFDNCNICGGDNSQCTQINGLYDGNLAMKPDGTSPSLITTVKFPEGATNIYVKKVSPRERAFSKISFDDYALFIHDGSKIDIRRGVTHEPYVGARLYYSGSMDKNEIIKITGKINREITLVIRKENSATEYSVPSFNYSFYIDINQREFITKHMNEYERQRNRTTRQSDYIFQKKTRETPETNMFHWKLKASNTCNYCQGNNIIRPRCHRKNIQGDKTNTNSEELDELVSDYHCQGIKKPKTEYVKCVDVCGYRWQKRFVYPYDVKDPRKAPCSSRCGEGMTMVVTDCQEFDKINKTWTASRNGDRSCIDAKLEVIPIAEPESCDGECSDVFWTISNWSQCSGKCSLGQRIRNLSCTDINGYIWPLKECLSQTYNQMEQDKIEEANKKFPNGPVEFISNFVGLRLISKESKLDINDYTYEFPIEEACYEHENCPGTIKWEAKTWSECKAESEKALEKCQLAAAGQREDSTVSMNYSIRGFQSRNVTCVQENFNIITELPEDICFARLGSDSKLPTRQYCSGFQCLSWTKSEPSVCSSECGPGLMTGQIKCHSAKYIGAGKFFITLLDNRHCSEILPSPNTLLINEDNSITPSSLTQIQAKHLGLKFVENVIDTMGLFQAPCDAGSCWVPIYTWTSTPWSECPEECHNQYQSRRVFCAMHYRLRRRRSIISSENANDLAEIDASICINQIGPTNLPEVRPCYTSKCSYWKSGTWSKCYGYCNNGIQRRDVNCSKKLTNEILLPTICEQSKKPEEFRLCQLDNVCPIWRTSEWSKCDTDCGLGSRRREVICGNKTENDYQNMPIDVETLFKDAGSTGSINLLVKDLFKNNLIPRNSECHGRQPVDKSECFQVACSKKTAFWWPSILNNQCNSTKSCDYGMVKRHFICIDLKDGNVNACDNLEQPVIFKKCLRDECKEYSWSSSEWSKCDKSCRRNFQYRSITCVDDFGERVSNEYCAHLIKPKDRELCPCKVTTCKDVQRIMTSPKDGTFSLNYGDKMIKIYCADMLTTEPKEYITLYEKNFSHNGKFVKRNISMVDDCCPSEGINCPNAVSVGDYSVETVYHKVRLNLPSLTVNVNDFRFAINKEGTVLPFASARDCFHDQDCKLGRFRVNFEGTDFTVDKINDWTNFGVNSTIKFTKNNKIVDGLCGGGCGACLPQNEIIQLTTTV